MDADKTKSRNVLKGVNAGKINVLAPLPQIDGRGLCIQCDMRDFFMDDGCHFESDEPDVCSISKSQKNLFSVHLHSSYGNLY